MLRSAMVKAGCLTLVFALLALAVLLMSGASALYFSGGVFEIPSAVPVARVTGNGYRAQQKLLELVLRESKHSSRRDPVVLTEQELNAFLAHHLSETHRIPLSPLLVRLTPGMLEIQGETALKNLFAGFPASLLPRYLPASAFDRPVWVTLNGTVEVPQGPSKARGKSGRLRVSEFRLGTQNLGPWTLSLLLGASGRSLFRWRVPAVVDTVTVAHGRVIITTRK